MAASADMSAGRLLSSAEKRASENPDQRRRIRRACDSEFGKRRKVSIRSGCRPVHSVFSEQWPEDRRSPIVRRRRRHHHDGAIGVLCGSATSTIILAIHRSYELWCRITGIGPKVLIRSQRFMLAADQRFRAQNMSSTKQVRAATGGFLRGAQVI
jgi:hypothetical protein